MVWCTVLFLKLLKKKDRKKRRKNIYLQTDAELILGPAGRVVHVWPAGKNTS